VTGRAVARLGPAGRRALTVLGLCPGIPTDALAQLLRVKHQRSATQLLGRLAVAGLVRRGPAPGDPPGRRRWSLTSLGARLVTVEATPHADDPWAGWGHPRRPAPGATTDATYRLLAQVVATLDPAVEVCGFRAPGIWSRPDAPRLVRVPAVALVATSSRLPASRTLLLVPDLGRLPIRHWRPLLRTLPWLAGILANPELVIGVLDEARTGAWEELIRSIANGPGESQPGVPTRVVTMPFRAPAAGDRRVFALLARHPLLTIGQVAALVQRPRQLVAGQVSDFEQRGLLVRATSVGLADAVWVTARGRRAAARTLGLAAGPAVHHHGVLGSRRDEARVARQLCHTQGVNDIFVAFVTAARHPTARGVEELEIWRSAAACARGRCRPDGYGSYRRGTARFGFFLEYDRGTEKPAQHAAKLAAYYRYRASARAARDYTGWPIILVVATDDAAAARFACQAVLAAERHAAPALPMLLTTTARIEATPAGVRGPVWATPDHCAWPAIDRRQRWPPDPISFTGIGTAIAGLQGSRGPPRDAPVTGLVWRAQGLADPNLRTTGNLSTGLGPAAQRHGGRGRSRATSICRRRVRLPPPLDRGVGWR
jgi:DNA-binding MarR family transcriptional regulator